MAATVAILMALTLSIPASAATVVTDPVRDALFHAPSFMDIAGAQLTEDAGRFNFQLSLAGAIPSAPPLPPPGTKEIWWSFALNTDPTTFPEGNPFPPTPAAPAPAEFLVSVIWDGSAFRGRLLDRRPLSTGGDAVVTPLPFTASGTEVGLSVNDGLIGNPSSLLWSPATLEWSSPPGATVGSHVVDRFDGGYIAWP
jgi:hypothetical protein